MKTLHFILAAVLCSFYNNGVSQTTYDVGSTTLTARLVKGGLDIPWEITWGPDDHIWMTERAGKVSRLDPETGDLTVLLDLTSQVYQRYESGMLGLALHPDFNNNPYVFIAYTYLSGSDILERMVKYTYDGTALINPETIIEGIEGNTTHIGARLYVLTDNTLLMTTGDAQDLTLPQNINSLSGKVLRFNLDGTVPDDNPIPGSYVYSWGHRNAQGLWEAPNGIIYSSEHGPTNDDELHIIHKARNYGWPDVTGFCDSPPELAFCNDSNVVEPLAAWTPTIAPSDIIWYDHPSIPEFQNKLLMTVLKDQELIAFEFDNAGTTLVKETAYLEFELGRLRDICISPDGKIYLATNGTSWSNTSPGTHTIIELHNADYIATSVDQINKLNVSLWPNPVDDKLLHINLEQNEQGEFSLFDCTGKLVYQYSIAGNNTLPLNINSGIYHWRVETKSGHKSEHGKLIVK